MRKGMKGMAMLLCACMMLEIVCGSAYAKQSEGSPETALTVEEAAVGSDVLTDAAEIKATEGQEAVPEERTDPEEGEAAEPDDVTGKEDVQETEEIPKTGDASDMKTEDARENEDISDTEIEDGSESADASESENTLEADGAGTLGTEDTEGADGAEEMDEAHETAAPELELDDALAAGDVMDTGISKESGKTMNAIEKPKNPDYYVTTRDNNTRLTFGTQEPEVSGLDASFSHQSDEIFHRGDAGSTLSQSVAWRLAHVRDYFNTVEFLDEIRLSGLVLFQNFSNLKDVKSNGKVDIFGEADQMFFGCTALESLDLSFLNVSGVTSMVDMFRNCTALKEINLTGWDTGNNKNMNDIFSGCDSLTKLTVGNEFKVPYGTNIGLSRSDGVWVKDDDRAGENWSDEEFLGHFQDANQGGTYIWGYKLIYYLNGGEVNGDEEEVLPVEVHLPDEKVNLKNVEDLKGTLKKEKATFIGWTEKKGYPTVKSKEEEEKISLKTESLTFHSGENLLYAAWAVDENENGTPDYDEEKVTVTFDINDGDGSEESSSEHKGTFEVGNQLPGMPLKMYVYLTLKWTKTWQKGEDVPAEHPAILAGWTANEDLVDNIILENDTDDDGAHILDKLENRTTAKVPETDTTYYAVYAADENGDHIADYLENSVQVEYYANGGTRTDGRWVDEEKDIFYRCSHHHVPFEEGVVLLDLDQGKGYVKREGAVLLGWSETVVKELVTSADAEKAAGIVTEITMPSAGNKKVYAVWAEDVNKNGTPDYKETKAKLTFDIGGGNGSEDPNPDRKDTFTVEVLPDMPVDLPVYSDLHWNEEWEKDGQPADHPAVFTGWTTDVTFRDIILEDDIDANGKHYYKKLVREPHVTVSGDVTYYAVYAADENGDGKPDFLEDAEQVEYYANGGKMTAGSWIDGMEGLFYRCGHHHVAGEEVTLLTLDSGRKLIERAGYMLLGWSVKETAVVTSGQSEAEAGIITTYTMPEGNGKVYAVWARDFNRNQIPDYNEEIWYYDEDDDDDIQEPKEDTEEEEYTQIQESKESTSSSSSWNVSEQIPDDEWQEDANGWKYHNPDGTYAANEWEMIDGKWYYFNENEYMATGWKQLNGTWYHLDNTSGAMDTDWYLDPSSGKWYYLDSSGAMDIGWQVIGDVWYHLDDASGAMDTDWYLDPSSGKWYYLDSSGAMDTGWQLVAGKYYYLNESAKSGRPYGSMYAGETTPDGYAVDASGAWIQ